MPQEIHYIDLGEGTAQPQRLQQALLPAHFQLCERGLEDWIALARSLAKHLKYYDLTNRAVGDWSAFLEYNNAAPIADIQVFLADPERFVHDPQKQAWLTRPHFTLFLTFLELLDLEKQEINRFTQRHLDHFYREILGIMPKPAEPDRVHLLFEPARGMGEQRIEAGALLQAGKTPDGKSRYVRTEEEIVVNRAKVSEVKVFFQERVYLELQDIYKAYLETHPGRFDEAMMCLIHFVLPENQPLRIVHAAQGYEFSHAFSEANISNDIAFLSGNVKDVLTFSGKTLGLSLYELRRLMALKQRQENSSSPDWALINQKFKEANAGFSPGLFDDFNGNFAAAIGFAPFPEDTTNHPIFSRVQNVNDIVDYYDLLLDSPGVFSYFEAVAQKRLSKDDFILIMEAFTRIRADWRAINNFLRKIWLAAGNNESSLPAWPDYPISNPNASSSFQARLDQVKPGLEYSALSGSESGQIDHWWMEIISLEQYFNLTAEELLFMSRLWALEPLPDEVYQQIWAYLYPIRSPDITPDENSKIGLLLDDAATVSGKTLKARRDLIALVEAAFRSGTIQQEGYDFMLAHLPLISEINTGDFNRLLQLLEKSYYSKILAQRVAAFEAKFRLISNSTAALHNRYKLLEHSFGSLYPGGNYYVLPPYPATSTAEQDTGVLVQQLANHWYGPNISEKAQARRFLESSFHLRVREFDDFLSFFIYFETKPLDIGAWNQFYQKRNWDTLYRLVAEAQFRRDKPDLRPRKMLHDGFFAAPDATLLQTARPGESHARWQTFGRMLEERDGDPKPPPVHPAELGLVIESPLLLLNGGNRTITLTLTGNTSASPGLAGKFEFFVSVGQDKGGFFKVDDVQFPDADLLIINLKLGPDAPPLTLPSTEIFRPLKSAPILKMVWKGTPDEYKIFADWQIRDITLQVAVIGLTPDTASNDVGEVDTKKPFEPFGAHPREGSKFTFAHAEINQKDLADLTLHFDWMGKPNGKITNYYTNYLNKYPESNPWKIPQVKIFGDSESLMVDDDASSSIEITVDVPSSTIPNIILELSGDFGHDQYLLRIQELEIKQKENTTNTEVVRPALNTPYTPKLKSFTFDYTTQPEHLDKGEQGDHRVWELHPFGIAVPEPGKPLGLTPQLPNEAALYVGLEDIAPLESVNILFQVAEGSADPDMERRPVVWQYLCRTGWRSEDARTKQPLLLSDPTNGLTQSAVLRFQLPADAVNDHRLLPSGKYWLRATIREHRQSVCDLIGIHPQAISAVRVLDDSVPDDPGLALSPQTVTGLLQRRSGIKAVMQPYSSFGGRSAEKEDTFYCRVAERLSHKQRAGSARDVECLLLEQFPKLYRVKCLPADQQLHNPGMLPGQVEVIVLPNLRGRLPQDPLQPRLPVAELDRMSAWLQACGPQAARYRVRNARFLPLKVEASLRLHPGYDAAYYLQQLDAELIRYLSPWAFDDNADIRFGGTVYVGQILNFIEERPYVDNINGLRLHWQDNAGQWHATTEMAAAPWPDVIWVSAEKHKLQLAESFTPARKRRGIGEVAVEIDFMVDKHNG